MTNRIMKLLGLVAAVGVVACNEPSTKPQPAPAPAQPARADEPDDSTPSARKLPVAEDFQAETAASIVQANYRAELEALETEMHAEAK